MVCFLSRCGTAAAVLPAAFSKISFAADDGLNPLPLHRVVERDCAIHVAVIGHGARVHTQRFETFGKWFDLDSAVEKTVISVEM